MMTPGGGRRINLGHRAALAGGPGRLHDLWLKLGDRFGGRFASSRRRALRLERDLEGSPATSPEDRQRCAAAGGHPAAPRLRERRK
jgi:hypothetical protein